MYWLFYIIELLDWLRMAKDASLSRWMWEMKDACSRAPPATASAA